MANHDYTRAGGIWNPLEAVLSAELADLDAKTVDSLSATGGTYALAAGMTIGGSPGTYWTLDVPFLCSEDVTVYGTLTAYDDVFLGGDGTETITIDGHVSLLGTIGVGATGSDALTVEAFTQFNGLANFNAATFFYDDATFSGESSFDGSAEFNNTVDFNQATGFAAQATFYEQTVFQKVILLTGEARVPQRQAIGGNADATYQAKTYTHVHVPDGTLTAIHYYTIGDTGAQNGDRMRFSTRDNSFDIGIKSPGGSLITLINASQRWVEVERIQGEWVMFQP